MSNWLTTRRALADKIGSLEAELSAVRAEIATLVAALRQSNATLDAVLAKPSHPSAPNPSAPPWDN